MLKLKVCGMREIENVRALVEVKPDYIGFIFYEKSLRFVGEDFNPAIPAMIPNHIKKVGVFVNSDFSYVINKIAKYGLDYVQLHGHESVDYCRNLSDKEIRVIKSFSLDDNFDFKSVEDYADCCEYFLFDTKTPSFGGSGNKFNWEILSKYQYPKPFFLSGGIGTDDIEKILEMRRLNILALDINSKFELFPGNKDIELIKTFFQKLKR